MQEIKQKDTLSSVTVSSTGTIVGTLNDIDNGQKDDDRLGRKITAYSVYVQGSVSTVTAINPKDDKMFRLIMYIDHQCNAAAPAVTDILESAAWNSFFNKDNSERFEIIIDEVYQLHQEISTALHKVFVEDEVEGLYQDIQFKASGNGIADVTSANIGCLYVCDINNAVTTDIQYRLLYFDS